MSRNDLVSFKVFLKHGNDVEVRRFSVETDAVTNFIFLKEKLQSLFPILRDGDYKITWEDADGDHITVTSDEELIIALTEMKDNVKVLHIIINPRRREVDDDDDVPRMIPRIICDGCETIISDLRYKCIQCPDFDLCMKCESQGLHPEHVMLRFSMSQYEMPRGTGKMLHNFFRGLRKSGHCAPKHHHKDKERRWKKESWHQQQASREENEAAWENLQQMARPYVDALLQGMNTQGCGEGAEFVRNIARGFFGEGTADCSGNKSDKQEAEKEKPAEKPMDVDTGVQQKEPIVVSGPGDWSFVQKDKPTSSNAPSASTPENPSHPNPVIADGLNQLRDMGFSNHVLLIQLLEKHDGNLPYVIRDLLSTTK